MNSTKEVKDLQNDVLSLKKELHALTLRVHQAELKLARAHHEIRNLRTSIVDITRKQAVTL